MVAFKLRRVIYLLCVLMLLVLPGIAAAQSSTFVVPFERVGNPGTTTLCLQDPLDPTRVEAPCTDGIPVPVDTGAYLNPCTLENVDVTGASTISTVQTVDSKGTVKVNVSVRTKGTGEGWVGADWATRTITGSTYAFDDNQQFSFRLPAVGQEFTSDFADKLSMRGAKSIDNWTIRAHFRIRVNAAGEVQVLMIKTTPDICKG